jgi:hypothetical protein
MIDHNYIPCVYVVKYIYTHFNHVFKIGKMALITLSISLFHTAIPFLLRYYNDISLFGNSNMEKAMIIILALNNIFYLQINLLFMAAG